MKKVSLRKAVAVLLVLTGGPFASCAKKEFAANKKEDRFSAAGLQTNTTTQCSGHTLVRPAVDFLFLWDNTSSQIFLNSYTKQALGNTIQLISNRFDYHILMAPLVGSGNTDAFLVANTPSGLNSSAMGMLIPQDQAASRLSSGAFTQASGGEEQGLTRAVQLVQNNISNGIFRKNAYTIIVLMSNGDDLKLTANGQVDTIATNNYISTQRNALINLRDNQLKAQQLRFISLVGFAGSSPQGSCPHGGTKQNYSYRKMSGFIYNSGGPVPANDNNGTLYEDVFYPDSYDICGITGTSFTHLFDGINDSIQHVVIKHVYDAWPISSSAQLNFNPDKLKVFKNTGQEYFPVTGAGQGPGFKYLGYTTRNTRELPTPGEPYTGHMIQLFGAAKVTYPECLVVQTETPAEYYGYVHLATKPVVTSIKLTINGQLIPQSQSNGWEYIGYKSSQNMKIVGPGNDAEASPPLHKSGYFLKVRGSAVYSNGANVQVVYDPAGS